MFADDPRTAALAEALRQFPVPETMEELRAAKDRTYEADAAAILADLPPGWCGHSDFSMPVYRKEIARLRRIEEAERDCSGSPKHYGGCGCLCHAALEEKP